ncbi:MAG: hypothetical protein A2Y77_07595 [Planctomycetes bacterium RBG_13_62_9]|nr:MAG: hypothetical protein A2Y77_07595 [Planctomycetes bacterium RBG_13_62_9]
MRVDATYDLRIRVGDNVRRGDRIADVPDAQISTAPVSGIVTGIRFDPASHEFVIVIAHAT